MAQRVLSKLADQTSGTATQLTITLPATSILPAAGTGTTGAPLSGLDGLFIETVASGATALTQGLTILDGTAPNSILVGFSPPAASDTTMAYHVGPNMGGGSNAAATRLFNAAIHLTPTLSIQATPGAATTVRIIVYGVRYI